MGTNYYWLKDICPTCQREKKRIHIGKSSAGWVFALHVDNEENIKSFNDWKTRFTEDNSKIINEYGNVITFEEMLDVIINRHHNMKDGWWKPFYSSAKDFHQKNNSENGPNGLVRGRIDGDHCIGHGEGTWDLIQGDFS